MFVTVRVPDPKYEVGQHLSFNNTIYWVITDRICLVNTAIQTTLAGHNPAPIEFAPDVPKTQWHYILKCVDGRIHGCDEALLTEAIKAEGGEFI